MSNTVANRKGAIESFWHVPRLNQVHGIPQTQQPTLKKKTVEYMLHFTGNISRGLEASG